MAFTGLQGYPSSIELNRAQFNQRTQALQEAAARQIFSTESSVFIGRADVARKKEKAFFKVKPLSFREELQAETDEWLA